jgi:hypothetical protein
MTAAWDVFQWAMFSLGCGSVLAVIITAAWLILAGPRLSRRQAPQPPVDDAVTMLARWDAEAPRLPARKPQAAPWPDGDTIVGNGMTTALNEMLRGDGRG